MRYKLTLKQIGLFTITFFLVQLCIAGEKTPNTKGQSRPAVIGIIDTTESKLSDIAFLLIARLSEELTISLVEREEIGKVLEELKLSASQLVSRESTLKLGSLLRADGMVFLSLSNDGKDDTKSNEIKDVKADDVKGTKILRVRLVDTRYGLRLLDTIAQWEKAEGEKKEEQEKGKGKAEKLATEAVITQIRTAAKIEQIVEELASRIFQVSQKLLIPPEDEVLIGILGIRNVDPSSRLNYLELSLPGLISSKLSCEPNIIVLEREDLNLVLEEKLFTKEKGEDTDFLGSMVLLEGEVEQIHGGIQKGERVSDEFDTVHKFRLKLQLKQANGTSLGKFKVKGNTERLPELTEKIATWLIKTITDSPPRGKWDIKSEAERFRREGILLAEHNDPVAVMLLETALALDRNQTETRKKLVDIFALSLNKNNARRLMNLMRSNYALGFTSHEDNWRMPDLMSFLNSHRSMRTAKNPDMKSLRKEAFDFCTTIWRVTKPGTSEWNYFIPAKWAPAVCSSLNDVIRIYHKHIDNVLELVDRDSISLGYAVNSLDCVLNRIHTYHLLYDGFSSQWSIKEQVHAFKKLLHPYLSSNRNWLAYLVHLAYFESDPGDEALKKCLKLIFDDFEYPDEPEEVKLWLRGTFYRLCTINPNRFPEIKAVQFEGFQQLLTPLIKRHDYATLDSFWVGFALSNRLLVQDDRREELRDLTIAVIDELNVLGYGKSNNLSALRHGLTRLYEQYPELRPKIDAPALTCKILYKLKDDLIMDKGRIPYRYYLPSVITFQENALWICLGTTSWTKDFDAILLRVNPDKKEVDKRWHFKIYDTDYLPDISHMRMFSYDGADRIAGLSVDNNIVYMAMPGAGVIFFDIQKTKPGKNCEYKTITTKQGLPGNNVTGIFARDDKLYLGFGGKDGGGFGMYNLNTGEWTMLASSRARKRKCPLDNVPTYVVSDISNYENQLFFIVSGKTGGLWKYDVDTDVFTRLSSVGSHLHVGGKKWYLTGDMCCFFDPKTEILQIVLAEPWPPRLDRVYMCDTNYMRHDKQFASFKPASGGTVQCIDRSAIYGNKVWFSICNAGVGLASKNRGDDAETMMVYDDRLLGGVQPTGAFSSSLGLIIWGKDVIGLIE